MSQITITKGKLIRNDKIEIEYQKNDGAESNPAECSEKHTSTAHKDLIKAFKCLAIHAALIGEYLSPAAVTNIDKPDTDLIKNFTVFGFEVDEEGVTLSARKTLITGKGLNFTPPKIKFNEKSEDAYPFIKNLTQCIDVCKDELTQYLNGKFAPDPQQKLFPEEKLSKVI